MVAKDPDWLRYRKRQKRSYLGTVGGGAIGLKSGQLINAQIKNRAHAIKMPIMQQEQLYRSNPWIRAGGLIGGAVIGNRIGKAIRNRNKKGYEPTNWG